METVQEARSRSGPVEGWVALPPEAARHLRGALEQVDRLLATSRAEAALECLEAMLGHLQGIRRGL